MIRPSSWFCAFVLLAACNAPATAPAESAPGARPAAAAGCNGPGAPAASGITPVAPAGLGVAPGFSIQTIARVPSARELAALADGDLLVGTESGDVYLVPNAEAAGAAGAPTVFASLSDSPAAGVAFAPDRCEVFIGTQFGVYATPYASGDRRAEKLSQIGKVRQCPYGGCHTVHVTTSVAYRSGVLFVGVGSDCGACVETDPTRAAVLVLSLRDLALTKRATCFRNPIALAVNPATGSLWAGGAGQDNLPVGHPYEFIDDVSSHPGVPDYGWPDCEENRHAYRAGADCSQTVEPLVELPAYSTIIGAAFYPTAQTGTYAFPALYRGQLFLTTHGSWHTTTTGAYAAAPSVTMVSMHGDRPTRPVDWSDPITQWQAFVGGFQPSGTTRIGRPTGITVGPQGSLFVSDDLTGNVYRIRPL